jgi:enterochelin esterase-like enzyme
LLLFITTRSLSQEKNAAIIIGERKTIRSSVLKESRDLLIYAPGRATTKLPLIIVFDGAGLFNATFSAVQFMNYYSEIPQMPEAIIIGIENTDRNRDMPIPQQYGGEKGEDDFLKFVRDEIIPWAG